MPNIPQVFGLDANGNKVPLPPAGGGSGRSRAQLNTLDSNVATALANAAAASAAAAAAQADATQALTDASLEYLQVVFPDATAATARRLVIAPLSGTLVSASGVFEGGGVAATAAVEVVARIAGVLVTLSNTLRFSADGVTLSRTATGNNVVTGLSTAILLTLTTANTTPGSASILLGFLRAPAP